MNWAALHKLADALTPGTTHELTSALMHARGKVPVSSILKAIKSGPLGPGQIADIVEAVPTVLQKSLLAPIVTATTDAAVGEVTSLTGMSLSKAFDLVNPLAVAAAKTQSASLVVAVSEDTKRAIRAIVTAAIEQGITPDDTARLIKTVVGLAPNQVKALLNHKDRLADAGYTGEKLDNAVERYARKAVAYRAETIARTELINSLSRGQQVAWTRAQAVGMLPPDQAKTWIVTPDDRLCDLCREMTGKPPVPLNAPFETPLGPRMGPTMHPRCRCSMGLVRSKATTVYLAKPVPNIPPVDTLASTGIAAKAADAAQRARLAADAAKKIKASNAAKKAAATKAAKKAATQAAQQEAAASLAKQKAAAIKASEAAKKAAATKAANKATKLAHQKAALDAAETAAAKKADDLIAAAITKYDNGLDVVALQVGETVDVALEAVAFDISKELSLDFDMVLARVRAVHAAKKTVAVEQMVKVHQAIDAAGFADLELNALLHSSMQEAYIAKLAQQVNVPKPLATKAVQSRFKTIREMHALNKQMFDVVETLDSDTASDIAQAAQKVATALNRGDIDGIKNRLTEVVASRNKIILGMTDAKTEAVQLAKKLGTTRVENVRDGLLKATVKHDLPNKLDNAVLELFDATDDMEGLYPDAAQASGLSLSETNMLEKMIREFKAGKVAIDEVQAGLEYTLVNNAHKDLILKTIAPVLKKHASQHAALQHAQQLAAQAQKQTDAVAKKIAAQIAVADSHAQKLAAQLAEQESLAQAVLKTLSPADQKKLKASLAAKKAGVTKALQKVQALKSGSTNSTAQITQAIADAERDIAQLRRSQWPIADHVERALGSRFPYELEKVNTQPWLNTILPNERDAIEKYTGSYYRNVNKAMRKTFDQFAADTGLSRASYDAYRKHGDVVSKALLKAPEPPPPELVWRGVSSDTIQREFGRMVEGQEVVFKGVSSTSINPQKASDFGATLFEIKPTAGAYVKSVSLHSHEYEYIIPDNARFRVVGIKKVKMQNMGQRTVIQLEMLPYGRP